MRNSEESYVTKSFEIKKDIAERFDAACSEMGLSATTLVTSMIIEFLERRNK